MVSLLSPSPVEIGFFPDYREFNPYQALLYKALGPAFRATPVDDRASLLAGNGADDAGRILHLHWETAVFNKGDVSAEAFLDALSGYRDRGARILWTVHNLMPHDERYRDRAAQVRSGLLDLSDLVHLHSLPALAALQEQQALPLDKIRIVPHGNFAGQYPAFSRDRARDELGLREAGMVVLLPGQMRANKNPEALVEAFLAVSGNHDRLILMGHRASDASGLTLPDDPRLVEMFGFASAEELARAHAAADFVVLPYRHSLTSGSAVLAQTLGRGILGSDTPGLRDVVQMPATGTLFDVERPGALADALGRALAGGAGCWAARGAAAAQAARARDWCVIGAAWRGVLSELARLPRPARVLAQ